MSSLTNDVHPIVRPQNFSDDYDYEAMLPSLRLFSHIITSPQSLHYYYTVLYGRNMGPVRPPAFKGVSKHEAPQKFASNKGIMDLNARDKAAVHTKLLELAEGVIFVIEECEQHTNGRCDYNGKDKRCTIRLNKDRYDELCKPMTMRQRLVHQFRVAIILLHEIAHSSSCVLRGMTSRNTEDFFEDSFIAEAGFEYVARVFGLNISFYKTPRSNEMKVRWRTWQSRALGASYDLNEMCRNIKALPKVFHAFEMSFSFIPRLFTDRFWQVTMLQGPRALIDERLTSFFIEPLSWQLEDGKTTVALPKSILDLYRPLEPSRATKKYRHLRNPKLELRALPREETNDEASVSEESDDPDQ